MSDVESEGYLPPIVANLTGDDTDVMAKLDELEERVSQLSGTPTNLTFTADTTQADGAIDDLEGRAAELDADVGDITVTADATQAKLTFEDLSGRLAQLQLQAQTLSVHLNTEDAYAQLAELRAAMDTLGGVGPGALTTDSSTYAAVNAQLDEIATKLAALQAMSTDGIMVRADTAEASAKLTDLILQNEAAAAALETPKTVEITDADAQARLLSLRQQAAELTSWIYEMQVDVDDDAARVKLASLEAQILGVNAQLADLGSQDTQDLAQLEASLGGIEAQLDKLDGGASAAGDSTHALLGWMLALGPAAAAVGAMAGSALTVIPALIGGILPETQAIEVSFEQWEQSFKNILAQGNDVGIIAAQLDQASEAFEHSTTGAGEFGLAVQNDNQFFALLAQAVENVFQAITGVMAAAGPILDSIGVSVDNVTAKFDKWSQDGGVESFFDRVLQVTPEVKTLFDQLADTVEHLGGGFLTLAQFELPVLDVIAELINDVTSLLGPFGSLGTELVGGALLWGKYGDTLKGVWNTITGIPGDIQKLIGWLGNLGTANTQAGQAAEAQATTTTAANTEAATSTEAMAATTTTASTEIVAAEEAIGAGAQTEAAEVTSASTTVEADFAAQATAAETAATEAAAAEATIGAGEVAGAGAGAAADGAGIVGAAGAADAATGGLATPIIAGAVIGAAAGYGIAKGINAIDGSDNPTVINEGVPSGNSLTQGSGGPGGYVPGSGSTIQPIGSSAAAKPSITVHSAPSVTVVNQSTDGSLSATAQRQVESMLEAHTNDLVEEVAGIIGS